MEGRQETWNWFCQCPAVLRPGCIGRKTMWRFCKFDNCPASEDPGLQRRSSKTCSHCSERKIEKQILKIWFKKLGKKEKAAQPKVLRLTPAGSRWTLSDLCVVNVRWKRQFVLSAILRYEMARNVTRRLPRRGRVYPFHEVFPASPVDLSEMDGAP